MHRLCARHMFFFKKKLGIEIKEEDTTYLRGIWKNPSTFGDHIVH
jgi:hypothetical protein